MWIHAILQHILDYWFKFRSGYFIYTNNSCSDNTIVLLSYVYFPVCTVYWEVNLTYGYQMDTYNWTYTMQGSTIIKYTPCKYH